jgi:hypothetical protein
VLMTLRLEARGLIIHILIFRIFINTVLTTKFLLD